MKLIFVFFSLMLSLMGRAEPVSQKYAQILESMEESELDDFNLTNFSSLDLVFDDCSSFPYYGLEGDGEYQIRRDFRKSISKAQAFLSINSKVLPEYVKEKFSHLSDILLDNDLTKTFHCRFGQTNSFIAIASGPGKDNNIERYGMATYPSIIFDTNRMAGNFPMDANAESFRAFYGNKLDGVDIVGGKRNPLMGKTPNSTSLVFHEMMHWTGSKHFNKSYVDIVYLSQFCIFEHPNITEKQSLRACNLLRDPLVWQSNREKRMDYIQKEGLKDFVKDLKDLYHSHY